MSPQLLLAVTTLVIVLIIMLGELRVSRLHERALLRGGAVEPPDPVYSTMRWAYPVTFVAMATEGALSTTPPGAIAVAGFLTLITAKALKFWAIASLGTRWTYRVLVVPGLPLVSRGPYKWMRHPNYVGVVGELIGMALLVRAPLTGVLSVAIFGFLLRHRIAAEERALGLG